MKFAIQVPQHFDDAIISLLSDAGYNTYDLSGNCDLVLVNTIR